MKELFDFVWELVIHTPWWVYVILVYAIIIGIKASKSQIVSIKRMFIIPILLIALSLHDLIVSVNTSLFTVSTWSLATFIGIVIGWWQVQGSKMKVDKAHHLIQTEGSWSTLIVILIIFVSKYYFGYQLAIDPNRNQDTQFEFVFLAVSGICAGLFIGRLICYVYRLYTGQQVNLKKP